MSFRPIIPTEGSQTRQPDVAMPKIDCFDTVLPGGDAVHVHQANRCCVLNLGDQDNIRITLMLAETRTGSTGHALLVETPATNAREIAAQLIVLAEQAEAIARRHADELLGRIPLRKGRP